jgi:hypothetical protein
MIRLAPLAALLLTAQVAMPPPKVDPDEAIKARALKLGYVLNGENMVRDPGLGSIDVSGLLFVVDSSLIVPPKPLAKTAD